MNTPSVFSKVRVLALLAGIAGALSTQAVLIPMSNMSSISNTFECSVTAMRKDVTIGTNNNVQAMIYADTGPHAAPLVTTNGIPILVINLKVGEMFICHFTNGLPNNSMDNLATIHWHGIELDNDSDGTAATQDAVTPGENYTYRFIPSRPGLYWFHNHINPGSSTFAGMYGLIIIPNNLEPALIASNTLPPADYTYTLALSDTEYNLTNGFVGKFLQSNTTNWYSINELGDLCHKLAIGDPGGDNGACNVAAVPGKTVLVNGATPTTNPANLYPLYTVPSGQRVRLHLLNEASSRDFRLTLLYPDPSRIGDTNLYRIGGQGGLLNNIRLEGGMQQLWDTKYNPGEIVMGSGQRADVLIYPTGTNGEIIKLVGNNLPNPFNLSGGANGNVTFPTNYPVAYFQISGSVTNYSEPTNGEPILAGTSEYVQDLKTNTVLNLLAAVPNGLVGTTNPTMVLQTGLPTAPGYVSNSPSINGFPYGELDANMGDGEFLAHVPTNPPTSRYAHVGDLLELSVSNSSGAVHPYHLHGFAMQPVRIIKNGTPGNAATTLYNFDYNEFIDTMEVYGGQTYVFRTRLTDRPKFPDQTTSAPGPILAPNTGDSSSGGLVGRWIYHCHIFLHVGLGMISEIDVLPQPSLRRPDLTTNGVAVLATTTTGSQTVADNFQCASSSYINDIHLWGSWKNNQVNTNVTFELKFWTDVPAGGGQPGRPGWQAWEQMFPPGSYTASLEASNNLNAQFYDPSQSNSFAANILVYRYDFVIPTNAFFQRSSNVYWLSATAYSTNGNFGWNSSITNEQFKGEAAWSSSLFGPHWAGLQYPVDNLYAGQGMDLAFALNMGTMEYPTLEESTPSGLPVPTVVLNPNPSNPKVAVAGHKMSISWQSGEVLQSADNVAGPWHDVGGATNPYVIPMDSPQRFYRIRTP